MYKLICDFCGKEIRDHAALTTVTVERTYSCVGTPTEEEMHFHIECATRIRNKVAEFSEEEMER